MACQLPHYILLSPLALIEAGEDCGVEHARHDIAGFTESLEAIGDEVVIVSILQGVGSELDRKSKGVQPLGNSAVDGNLKP